MHVLFQDGQTHHYSREQARRRQQRSAARPLTRRCSVLQRVAVLCCTVFPTASLVQAAAKLVLVNGRGGVPGNGACPAP